MRDVTSTATCGRTTTRPRWRSGATLKRIVDLQTDRILFSHGGEVSDPGAAIRQLLDRS
jgi:hypothetical protein